jgi:hypothetical protein
MEVLTPASLLTRASVIRMPLKQWAGAAKLHPNTLKRLDQREGREHRATIVAADEALTKEERKLLEHLLQRFDRTDLLDQIFVPAPVEAPKANAA